MQPTVKSTATPWKIALALLFGVFLVGMAASFVIASRRGSRVVDADYYSHGLHYDQTRTGSKNAGLNWTMSASLAGGELQVQVSDESGAPVAGGELRFEPQAGNAGLSRALALAESAPGIFRAPRPVAPNGELHGVLRFTRGEAAASHRLVLFN
jgi:nitrogen fixation protein FixH